MIKILIQIAIIIIGFIMIMFGLVMSSKVNWYNIFGWFLVGFGIMGILYGFFGYQTSEERLERDLELSCLKIYAEKYCNENNMTFSLNTLFIFECLEEKNRFTNYQRGNKFYFLDDEITSCEVKK